MRKLFYIFALSAPLLLFSALTSDQKDVSKTPGQHAADRYNDQKDQIKPLTIYQNNYGGRVLALSNGKKWEIYRKDTVHSGGWLSGELTIEKQDDYRRSGDKMYRYKIYNKTTNDSVWARPIPSD